MEANYELEEMRQQLAILHNKLEQQTLVNHDLMRRAMSDNYSAIARQQIGSIVVAVLSMPLMYFVFSKLSLSTAFIIFTEFILIIGAIMAYRNFRELHARNFLSENISSVIRKFQTHKKNEAKRTHASLIIVITFFVWFVIEMSILAGEQLDVAALILSIVGIVLGAISQILYNRKMQKIEAQLLQLDE